MFFVPGCLLIFYTQYLLNTFLILKIFKARSKYSVENYPLLQIS